MNKKILKFLAVALITVLCIISSTSQCFAAPVAGTDGGGYSGGYSGGVTTDQINGKANIETGNLVNAGNQIATIIRVVGIILSVIILMILGIKYMMGSASEKAEYKKTMIPYVIGAVVLFGASALAGAIVQLAQGITGS